MARSGIRGSRIGAGPRGENERGPSVTRIAVTFWCAIGHSTSPIFAASAEVPATWDCHACDRPAGLDPDNPRPWQRRARTNPIWPTSATGAATPTPTPSSPRRSPSSARPPEAAPAVEAAVHRFR